MRTVFVCAIMAMMCFGASAPPGSGHWEGTYTLPEQNMPIVVDLVCNDRGEWTGSMGFPDDRVEGIELADIKITGRSVFFASREKVSGIQAELSEDGSTMKGGFLIAYLRTAPVPLTLRRVAEARVKAGPPSTPVASELLGTWSGVVKYGRASSETDLPASRTLPVRFTIEATPGGVARGSMTHPYDSAKKVALTTVSQNGAEVRLEGRSVMAVFTGRLRGSELAGEWKQFGTDAVPLTLTKLP